MAKTLKLFFPISPLPRLPPSGALSFLLCPRPSASLRNQTFPVTDRQRPVEDVYPGRYRSMLRVSDSQKVQSPRPGRGARTSSPTRSPGDGGTHATAPAEPGRDRTFVGSRTSPGVCWEGAGAQPRHIGLRKERFDLRTRRSEAGGKGRGRGPARPGGGGGEGPQGLHANAEPRPEGGGVAAAAEPGALRSQGRSARFRAEGDSAGRERREPGRARAAGLTALAAAAAPDDVGPGASCLLRRDLRLFMAKSGQSRSRRARRACPAREP